MLWVSTEESLGDDAHALQGLPVKPIDIAERQKTKFAAPYVNLSAYYNREKKPDLALEYAREGH